MAGGSGVASDPSCVVPMTQVTFLRHVAFKRSLQEV